MVKLFLMVAICWWVQGVCAQHNVSGGVSTMVDNKGDKLYTTLYPNPQRPTVILLHGGPGFPSDLLEVVALLKDSFQVIAFHQRGTSLSPCRSKNYTMEAYISDIEAIRVHYGVGKFHLWGHSWGGLYAQVYAERYPMQLLSLFLCCPGSGTGAEWKQTEKEVLQLNRAKCTSWQWAGMGWNSMWGALGSGKAHCRLFKRVMINYNKGFVSLDSLGLQCDNFKAAPINKTRAQIAAYPLLAKQPNPPYKITIVYGDQDIYQSSKQFVLNRYPTATVYTIPHCGHIPWLHNPSIYAQFLHSHFN